MPWCADGRYLDERPSFTLDPLFHAGAYYVQEASSMLIEQAFLATGLKGHDILALDLCAAPGGKSTHLASLLTPGSMLVCNEAVPTRRAALLENLWKHGRGNTMVAGSQPSALDGLEGLFNLILVDAPCSGEGMFRKDPFARQQWSEGLVRSCTSTQQDILHHAWNALSPGGYLIYSTCTWEQAENEGQVLRLITQGAEPIALASPAEWGTIPSDVGLRCYPHLLKGEGFFLALLQKPGQQRERARPGSASDDRAEERRWLQDGVELTLCEQEDVLYASAMQWSDVGDRLKAVLNVIAPGIPVAERKGTAWRPHAALALNELLSPKAFGAMNIEREQALAFLRGETGIGLGSNGADMMGVRLLRYGGLPLGWMYAAGDRWNNGWPKAWRIRMR